jgi:type IX secretion system PorP/SprF family membrane protein
MKRILLILLMFAALSGYGQQLPLYTQYMFNDFVMNPAVTGTNDSYIAKSNNRYQWVGITDAPRTYILSIYGPDKKQPMGYGGYIYSDITGPTSRTGANLSYAYNLQIKDEMRLSMGLSVGLLQFKIDGQKITLHDAAPDNSLGSNVYVDYLPDASFGAYFYDSKSFYAGICADQLFHNKVKFDDVIEVEKNRLANHFFLYGGYIYPINDEFQVEPSLMLRYMNPVPLQMDLSAKVIYKKMIWMGLSWRTKDAFSVMIGYNHQDQLFFGYSYDMTLSNIRHYSSGTHELMVSAKFSKVKKKSSSTSKIQ